MDHKPQLPKVLNENWRFYESSKKSEMPQIWVKVKKKKNINFDFQPSNFQKSNEPSFSIKIPASNSPKGITFKPKNIKKSEKLKRFLIPTEKSEKNYSFIIFQPVSQGKNSPETIEPNFFSESPSIKSQQSKKQKVVNCIELASESFIPELTDNANVPSLNFPSSFPPRKKPKKQTNLRNSDFYEKYFINLDNEKASKLEKILKASSTPTPEKKLKYIKHESYKAGYFLSKIDKILSSIRVKRSKSINNHIIENSN